MFGKYPCNLFQAHGVRVEKSVGFRTNIRPNENPERHESGTDPLGAKAFCCFPGIMMLPGSRNWGSHCVAAASLFPIEQLRRSRLRSRRSLELRLAECRRLQRRFGDFGGCFCADFAAQNTNSTSPPPPNPLQTSRDIFCTAGTANGLNEVVLAQRSKLQIPHPLHVICYRTAGTGNLLLSQHDQSDGLNADIQKPSTPNTPKLTKPVYC